MTGKEFAKKVRAWRPAGLWQHHDFVRLWTAAGISAAGTQVTLLALPLTAILVLHASAFEVAALATAATVPNLALGIAAGIWLDRVQRRPVMVAADFGRAVVLASVPVAYVFGVLSLPQLYLVALIGGSLNVLFDIASGAYLPLVVPRMQLVEANAKLQAAIVGAQAAGPSIGGALVTLLSAPMAIVVDAVSFVISGSLIASANARDQVQREPQPKMTPVRTELRQAARYLLSDPYLQPLLVGHALANLALGLLWAIVIVYAVRVLGLMPATLGVILSLGQVGGVIGAAFAHRIAERAGVGRVVVRHRRDRDRVRHCGLDPRESRALALWRVSDERQASTCTGPAARTRYRPDHNRRDRRIPDRNTPWRRTRRSIRPARSDALRCRRRGAAVHRRSGVAYPNSPRYVDRELMTCGETTRRRTPRASTRVSRIQALSVGLVIQATVPVRRTRSAMPSTTIAPKLRYSGPDPGRDRSFSEFSPPSCQALPLKTSSPQFARWYSAPTPSSRAVP